MNEKSLCPNTEFVCPKEGETDRDNGDWVGPNTRVDTRFGGTNPNVNETDELGAPKRDGKLLSRNKGVEPVPNLGWEHVPEGLEVSDEVEPKTVGNNPNMGVLEAPKGG